MALRNVLLALAVVAVAVAVLLVVRSEARRPSIDTVPASSTGTVTGDDLGGSGFAGTRDLPKLKGVPDPPPATATATTEAPMPAAPTALALAPTPADVESAALALADANQPVAFPALRFWVDRYLAGQPRDPQAGVRLDHLFPPSILGRFAVPPETQVLTVADQPAIRPGALDEAFRPQPGKTWRVTLRLRTPGGEQVERSLVLRH